MVHIESSGNLDLKIKLENGSQWDLLILHTGNHDLKINEVIELGQDAELNLSYGQFTHAQVSKVSEFNLIGQGSVLNTHGAVLANGVFNWKLQSNHLARHTYASLNTNVVVQTEGFCDLEVVGSIPKGYSQSKTHQMSKILNLGDQSAVHVYPKLLIDENDVEASHAASVGQPEEEHIYYLMSRGLSRTEALNLLIKGYLHPVVSSIEDKDLQQTLINLIDEKVAV